MSAPIALQLYTIREELGQDFRAGIERIAQMGYVGVETAGFPGTTVEDASKLFKDLGLAVCSAHTGLPVGDDKNDILDTIAALGCSRIISGRGPDDFKTVDLIKKTCELFNQAGATAKQQGFAFGIHNHWWEFEKLDGRPVYQIMLECLAPEVFFEIDTYWAQTGGSDPVKVVAELGSRAPLLHIKDGPCVKGEDMVAVGEGKVDFPGIVQASGANAEWMIVELDSCGTDMMEAVEKSYCYLADNHLARGR